MNNKISIRKMKKMLKYATLDELLDNDLDLERLYKKKHG